MDKMLKLGQKLFGVVAGVALLLGVLSAPIGEAKADPGGDVRVDDFGSIIGGTWKCFSCTVPLSCPNPIYNGSGVVTGYTCNLIPCGNRGALGCANSCNCVPDVPFTSCTCSS